MNWLKASYRFHTYCYRDPRSAFSSGIGVPVVSPTTVFLGIASSLFRLGRKDDAEKFLSNISNFNLYVDTPDGIIFFRAFHQVRRYESKKWDLNNPRLGLTLINQATKEYGIVEGEMKIYIKVSEDLTEVVRCGLENLTHLGTRDSLCSLQDNVEQGDVPNNIIYYPSEEIENPIELLQTGGPITMVTLSRFTISPKPIIHNWYMAGEKGSTELITFVIPGKFQGTTRGKVYKKK